MSRRKTLGQALKTAAINLARAAERYVGANDATPCQACKCPRSSHCGCGAHCFGPDGDDKVPCKCEGFTPPPIDEPEEPQAA